MDDDAIAYGDKLIHFKGRVGNDKFANKSDVI